MSILYGPAVRLLAEAQLARKKTEVVAECMGISPDDVELARRRFGISTAESERILFEHISRTGSLPGIAES